MNDKYAHALEHALANWYYCGDNAPTEPVFNALSQGMKNGMQLLVPIEIPEAILKQLAEAGDLSEGMTFSLREDVGISFKHIPADEHGHYLIPLFTSEEQLSMGDAYSSINQSFDVLLKSLDKWPDCLGFVINPYSNKILINKDIRDKIADFKAKSHVAFVRGSVLDMNVSAIVNSAHRTLLGGKEVDEILLSEGVELAEAFLVGGGLNGAIHEAAGIALFNECRELGGCEEGGAKITKAYDITNADYIIHVVGPVYGGEETEERDREILASCYRSALDLALENDCDSVAFPCISAGANGYPIGKAAYVALVEVIEWFEAHPETVMNVYLCSFTDNEYRNYLNMIKR